MSIENEGSLEPDSAKSDIKKVTGYLLLSVALVILPSQLTSKRVEVKSPHVAITLGQLEPTADAASLQDLVRDTPVVVPEPAPEPPQEPMVAEVIPTPPPVVREPVKPPKPVRQASVQAPASQNEATAWNFLISQGFTRNQAAGIMGNLHQEHKFLTSDVGGGLGIAQWLGARRARLIAKGNHLDINVQLNFLMEELNTSENAALRAIEATDTVEGSVIAFEKKFERCGNCKTGNRIKFAQGILARY